MITKKITNNSVFVSLLIILNAGIVNSATFGTMDSVNSVDSENTINADIITNSTNQPISALPIESEPIKAVPNTTATNIVSPAIQQQNTVNIVPAAQQRNLIRAVPLTGAANTINLNTINTNLSARKPALITVNSSIGNNSGNAAHIGGWSISKARCQTDADCSWCGNTCAAAERNAVCPAIMPPEDYACVCSISNGNGWCIAEKRYEERIYANLTQNTVVNYTGTINHTAPDYTIPIDYNGPLLVLKNYTPINYNGTLIYQNYTSSATLNMSRVLETVVNGVTLKEQNISSIIVMNASVYEIKSVNKRKLFGIVPIDVGFQARVNPNTGEVTQMKKPWWSFLVR